METSDQTVTSDQSMPSDQTVAGQSMTSNQTVAGQSMTSDQTVASDQTVDASRGGGGKGHQGGDAEEGLEWLCEGDFNVLWKGV